MDTAPASTDRISTSSPPLPVRSTDAACTQLLDAEFRTIARRVLARIAANGARALHRGTSVERTAAAIVWLVGQASGVFGPRVRRRSGALWEWFGVGSCVDRGRSLSRSMGSLPDPGWHREYGDPEPLGDPGLLHSSFRAALIRQRDTIAGFEEERRPWSGAGDGQAVRVRTDLVRPLVAMKGLLDGSARVLVTIGVGLDVEDARYFGLSVPDARELVAMIERALDEPSPLHRR